jgi:protein-tyrosine phosphatase
MAKRVFCHPVSGSVLLWGGKSDAMSPSNATTHIVNVAHGHGVTIRAKHQKSHIEYSSYSMVDDELLQLTPSKCTAMREMCEWAVADVRTAMLIPGSQVLVNCYAGRNRSGVVILSYLLQEHNWRLGFDKTVSFMRNKTSNALSNRALILACIIRPVYLKSTIVNKLVQPLPLPLSNFVQDSTRYRLELDNICTQHTSPHSK